MVFCIIQLASYLANFANIAISEHWKCTSGELEPMASGESQPMMSEESTTSASVSSSVLNGSEDDVSDLEAFRDPDKCS